MAEFDRENSLRWFGHVQRRDKDETTRNRIMVLRRNSTFVKQTRLAIVQTSRKLPFRNYCSLHLHPSLDLSCDRVVIKSCPTNVFVGQVQAVISCHPHILRMPFGPFDDITITFTSAGLQLLSRLLLCQIPSILEYVSQFVVDLPRPLAPSTRPLYHAS